jgi:tRNA (adenine57-N1/adenine58-N1)-methyltransferase
MVSKILFKAERKRFVEGLDREVIVQKYEEHLISNIDKDFHTQFGMIKKDFFKEAPGSKTKVGNQEYLLLDPSFIDLYKRIDRLAQIIPLKDVASIISNTGMNKESFVVDAGSGSGGFSLFAASIAKNVVTYDVKEEHSEIVRKNIDFLGLKNIVVKVGNIYDSDNIDERDVDVFVLDVPEPKNGVRTAEKILKVGGFLVVYSPCIPPMQEFVDELRKSDKFLFLRVIEILERDWEFDGRKVRPRSQQIGHSGFLAFVRRI